MLNGQEASMTGITSYWSLETIIFGNRIEIHIQQPKENPLTEKTSTAQSLPDIDPPSRVSHSIAVPRKSLNKQQLQNLFKCFLVLRN